MDLLDLIISSLSFLTIREKILLRNNLDSLDKVVVLSIEEISQIIKRMPRTSCFDGPLAIAMAKKAARIMENKSIKALRYDSAEFPPLLREINDPPYMIFYMGDIGCLWGNCVSVVGTRRVCQETARSAFEFSREAAENGMCVVSGLANGIDGFAHSGALDSKKSGCTAAVLPCGIDQIVPVGHKALAKRMILEKGCLLSEYLPGTPAEPWRFVQRNRIIAALSGAVVVIQAPCGSGALITADFAVDYNRELFFHKACFCKEALEIDTRVKKRLVLENAKESRLKRTSESYVEDGAMVIGNYKDYAGLQQNAGGMYFHKINKQLQLFDLGDS